MTQMRCLNWAIERGEFTLGFGLELWGILGLSRARTLSLVADNLLQNFFDRSLQAETNSIDSCVEKLNLSSLKKDRIITSEQMIKCCERLKRETFLGLDNMQLIISNYYGISGDGDIRIPWQWRK